MSVWLMAAALAVGNAPADTSHGEFRVGTVSLRVPVPEGYCLPEGKDAAAAQLLAAGDRDNVTHFTVIHCDEKLRWVDYYLIKTPTVALLATLTNAEFQQTVEPMLVRELDSNTIMKDVAKGLSDTFQTKVDLAGKITYLGKDDMCLYLGGVFDVKVEAGGTAYTLAMAQCMTVVDGKILNIYRYGGGNDRKAIEALMPSAKAMAKAVRPASIQ